MGGETRSRAEEYHGRKTVKQTTEAAYEEFSSESTLTPRRWTPTCATRRSSSTASSACSTSSSASCSRPATPTTRCWSGSSSSASSGPSSASSSWCASPACASRSRPASPRSRPTATPRRSSCRIVQERAWGLMKEARQCWAELLPELDAAGIHIVDYARLDASQQAALETYFEQQVFPVLTPLAFDPGRPFPHISNMSHNLAVLVRDQSGEERFARVKVPGSPVPRLVPVPAPAGHATVAPDGAEPRARVLVHLARAGHRRQPAVAVPGHGGPRVARLPRHPRRRARHPGARGRRPARDHREVRAPPPLRLGHPRHRRREHARAHPRHPQGEPRARASRTSTRSSRRSA